jgi:hypothetical protein
MKSTLANCCNFELGSLEVVITILGSWIPAREYSLSICVAGSEAQKDGRVHYNLEKAGTFTCLGLIKREITAQLLGFLPQLGGKWLAARQSILQVLFPFIR